MRTTTDKALLLLLLPLLLPWSAARAETCAETLKLIQALYNKTVDVCPDGEEASTCSGLIIRGTTRADPTKGQKWDVWNDSDRSLKQGTTSYSFLRSDINFPNLAVYTNNGFIIAPSSMLCAGQKPSYV